MQPFTQSTPLRLVNEALLRAIEEQDLALLTAAAPGWRRSRKENASSLVQWVWRQAFDGPAVGHLVAQGYPVTPAVVEDVLRWLDLFGNSAYNAWKDLLPAVVGRPTFHASVLRGLERSTRPSLFRDPPVIRWEALDLDQVFPPESWQIPLHRMMAVFDSSAPNDRAWCNLTPLQWAWAQNNPLLCEGLIQAGAPMDVPVTGSSWPGWCFEEVLQESSENIRRPKARKQVESLVDERTRSSTSVQRWKALSKKLPALRSQQRQAVLSHGLPEARCSTSRPRF